MSSLRNAVARRPHKERSQPQAREKWGLLEKHKDYSLRARDYNVKKQKLAQLSSKAREKNPDEFAFGMVSQGKAGLGKHRAGVKANGDKAGPLSHDAVKLLKTQDAGYLRTIAAKGRKDIQKLSEEVGLDTITLGHGADRRRIFPDDDLAPANNPVRPAGGASARTHLGEVDENVLEEEDRPSAPTKNTPPKSKKVLAAKQDAAARLRTERKKRRRLQEMRAARLEALKKRQREIVAAADELELQRAKMARSVGGVNKNGVKFKIRERRR